MTNRSIAPNITIPSDIKVKKEILKISEGGVKIYTLPFLEYDVVRVSLVFRGGVKYQNTPFSASTVAGMLSEGCAGYSSSEIADFLDFYGIFFDQTVDRDHSVITICSLERFFDKSLEILSSLINSPTFPIEELEIYKMKRKQAISMQRAKIDYVARENFGKAMYGENHPYGISYDENQYDYLTTNDLKEFYEKAYTRSNLFVVCSGKVTEDNINKITALVDSLPQGEALVKPIIAAVSTTKTIIPWKDSIQSAIRVGRMLFPRNHPDFVAMQVVSTILGGYFGSRLISNLREDKGYTYGIFSGIMNMEDSGYLAITTEVESGVTEKAIAEIYLEIRRMKEELVPIEELSMVKNVMIGEIMRILDGPFGIADITIENILTGRTNDYLHENIKEIREITPERVLEMSKKYLTEDEFVTVIVGNID